jgi:hypothetical protein
MSPAWVTERTQQPIERLQYRGIAGRQSEPRGLQVGDLKVERGCFLYELLEFELQVSSSNSLIRAKSTSLGNFDVSVVATSKQKAHSLYS